MVIVTKNEWNKETYGIGNGWDNRTVPFPKTIIVHTTNGHKGSVFENEVSYIARSQSIGAHYVISKQGKIVQTLHPSKRAWHAGAVDPQLFNNNNSIGIEVHYTPGEGLWTQAMKQSLTNLCAYLIQEYTITDASYIETHRKVAVPKGRKIDPSGLTDTEFYAWRSAFFNVTGTTHTTQQYRVIYDNTRVRSAPHIHAAIVQKVHKGFEFIGEIVNDVEGTIIQGQKTWVKIITSTANTRSLTSRYIHSSLVKLL